MSVSVTSTRWERFNVHSCVYPFIPCIQPRVTEVCWKIKRGYWRRTADREDVAPS
jgi:hypothetical protein